MNPILDPAGGRSAAVYWRRRAVFFAALAVVLLLMVRACGGDGPNLSKTAVQEEVPLVSTFTPTPRATATGSPASDPAVGNDPYNPCATDVSAGPVVDPALTDEAGQPLCEEPTGTASPTLSPTLGPTVGARANTRATKGPKATPTAATPKPTSDSASAGPTSCAKAVLSVRLKADKRVYTATEKPKLYLGVKNSGPAACLVDMGSRALSFTIISGKDRIWSSDDCQGKGTSDIRLLKPGQTLWARAVWGKVRSKPGCPKGQPTAKPGTYVVDGSAGGVKARQRAVFEI